MVKKFEESESERRTESTEKDARSAPERDKFIITKFTNGDLSRKYFDAVSKKKGNQ